MGSRTTRSGKWAGLLALTFTVAAVLGGEARAASGEDRAAAQALFDDARRLMKSGHAAEACPKLEESQRLDPGVGTQLYLGECYEKTSRTASAWAEFLDAADAAAKAGDEKRRHVAEEYAKKLEPKVARVRLMPPSGIDGLTITRDGKAVTASAMSSALPIDEGHRVFEASAPGRKNVKVEVDIAAGEQKTVRIPELPTADVVPPPLTPASSASAPASATTGATAAPPPPASDGGGGTRMVGFVVTGIGAATLVPAIVLGLNAKSASNDAKSSGCRPDGTYCTPTALQQNDTAKTKATVSTVLFVVGGAMVAAGITLVVLGGSSGAESAALYVAPTASPTTGGFTAGGTF
jgi:serine/threonine-protein kinase